MSKYSKGLLQIPQGTEGIYLEEAYIHRRIVRSLEELFTGWGYLPAQVPIFDFFDTYRKLIGEGRTDSIYRLVDRDGDLLILRPDITLFLAKQVGPAIHAKDLPLRICYADSILRHQDSDDISRNEFFQVGAELVGVEGMRGDIEVLAMLAEVLALLDLPDVHIHLGSRHLLALVCGRIGAEDVAELAAIIEARDRGELRKSFTSAGIGEDVEMLTELFLFLDEPAEFSKLVDLFPRGNEFLDSLYAELSRLKTISKIVAEVYPDTSLRIDLSEIGSQDYYTGVVFQAYAEGADSAIASGGRYDELLGYFGSSCASVGFSMFLRKIESLVGRAERFSVPEANYIEQEDMLQALKDAKETRANGGIAIL